jgi:hypothetical protein
MLHHSQPLGMEIFKDENQIDLNPYHTPIFMDHGRGYLYLLPKQPVFMSWRFAASGLFVHLLLESPLERVVLFLGLDIGWIDDFLWFVSSPW